MIPSRKRNYSRRKNDPFLMMKALQRRKKLKPPNTWNVRNAFVFMFKINRADSIGVIFFGNPDKLNHSIPKHESTLIKLSISLIK